MPESLTTATRAAGLARMAAFLDRAGREYARSRNHDFGPGRRDNVSQLSPFLRHRLVLEEELLASVLECHSASAAQKFVEEIFWRAYFKGWLEQHPRVWTDYRDSVDSLVEQLETDSGLLYACQRAVNGDTGIDCFDAWARELVTTGYLHNHTRMWFASIWVFTLRLPWQLGADFFLRHLLDGDPASNTLGWRWVSGLHTAGKNYLARASNIANYTQGRFNPEGQLAERAPALTEDRHYVTEPLPKADQLPEDEPFGLLVTEEDCAPEIDLLQRAPAAILGLTATRHRSPLPVSERICRFADGAINDALKRAEQFIAVAGVSDDGSSFESRLVEWAGDNNLRVIVTPYAPVGPVRDLLDSVDTCLARHDIELRRVRRRYDELCWPHATRGFFKLKKKIPAILKNLDQTGD